MSKYITYLFFLLNFFSPIFSQSLQLNSLTVKDGLSQHDISAVLQDSEGFIWIATYDGLNKYDGYEVTNYFHNNNRASLSSNRLRCLFEENSKRLWIGTDGYGLNYYNLENDSFSRVKVPLNYEIINDINKNSEQEIIAATTQGLIKLSEKNGVFFVEILQTPITGFNIKKIKTLSNGNTIYVTNKGLWLNDDKDYTLIKGSDYIAFNTIIETTNGEVWAAGESGLYQIIKGKLISKKDIVNSNIFSMVEGINNDIWITTFQNGLLHFSLNSQEVRKTYSSNNSQDSYLESNPLKFIFKDVTNTLWISNTEGLVYSNLNSTKFKSIPLTKKGLVRTLFTINDKVYYGLQADKFYSYSFTTKKNKEIDLPKSAKAFRVDTLDGKVHLATTNGLYKEKDNKDNEFEMVPIFEDSKRKSSILVTNFCKDKHKNKYFGTFKGLIVKNKETTYWIHEKYKNLDYLRDVRIFSLKVDYFNNCIWVGSIAKGLFKINLDKQGAVLSVETYNEQMTGLYKIPNNSIWSFYQDRDNSLYVGTDTGLLLKRPNENKFKPVLEEDIQNKKIMGIICDDFSNLWLNNSQGLIKYNTKTKTTTKFNYFDGLLTNTFTEAISKNNKGQLFFGNILGINYFKSGALKENPFPSKIAFTNLLVNNNKISVNQKILGSIVLKNNLNRTENLEFNYKQNDFSIEFTSTNYSNVKVNKYRYKLENYDKDWKIVDNTKRFASYSNIPSGDYKLIVEATNPKREWSNTVKTILITVYPAPWNTWWAYLIYFLIFSSILYTLIYFWSNKEKLRNQIELSNFKNEQEKKINEMKLTFFTDVAHEFKTPLSLIIGPLNDLIDGNNSKKYKEFCYSIVSRNTNRMMNLVNQLLDFRKVNSGLNILKVSRNDMCSFVQETTKSFEWQAKTREIELKIISPESYFCHFDKDVVEKVIYNLLSNAFKYTPNKGIIEIEIKPTWKQDLEYFVILIKDSGKGISQQDKKRIFERHFHGKDRSSSGIGLHLTSTLIDAHKGEINVLNSALGGTEFMITLPVSSKAFTEEEFLSKDDIPGDIPLNYIPGGFVEQIAESDENDLEKILIVEDDYDLRKYLKNILISDYTVIEANNGREGLNKALEHIPDIIISDVMMPEIDGIEMCEQIKNNTLISHIPVLMLTAKTGDEYYNKGLQIGAWDYIAKPFNSRQLLQKLKNIIKTRNSFRQFIASDSPEEVKSHYVSYDQKFVKNVTEIVNQKMTETNFSATDLSNELGLSRMQLHRKLKALVGKNTTAFVNDIKIKRAIELFDNGCDRVQEAMDVVGVNSYSHFITLFKKEKGVTPSKYIEQLKEASDKNNN